MAKILTDVVDFYVDLMENGDSRVQNWPMMKGPLPTISICLSYVIFVKFVGPYIMKYREPLNIRWLMILYNFLMVIISAIIFFELGFLGWFTKYNWKCQPVDYSNSSDAISMVHLSWWYYLSKYLEFTDTIFFVLRKKFTHVSTLHVIHHGIMPMSVWWGVKFTPGGHSTFFAFVNSLVHIVMYFYYGLAAIGPSMNKFLWWKKYMTAFQMVQFIAIFVHSFQLLFRDCNYPRGFMWWIGFHAILFWFLFADFYKNTYSKGKRTVTREIGLCGFASYDKLMINDPPQPNGKANGKVNGKVNGNVNGNLNGKANGKVNGYTNGIHKPCENGNGIIKRSLEKSHHQD